jgi:hypothetical protein
VAEPTPDDVAGWLGIPAIPGDDRLTDCTTAAVAWVEKRRSLTPVDVLWADPDTHLGAVMYAALLYSSRAQPQGFPGFDQLGVYSDDVGMSIHRVYQLVGQDPVTA